MNRLEETAGLELLLNVAVFRDLPREALIKMSKAMVAKAYAKGSFIFHQDSPGTALFLVESGRVHISRTNRDGKSLVLAILSPGEFFGELALLDKKPRSADAVAGDDCRLYYLNRDSFISTLMEFPDAALALIKSLAARLRETNDLVEEAAFLDVPGRLAKTLLGLADPSIVTITQSRLADMIGVTRESVAKNLKLFERLGMVRRDGRSLVILSPERLRQRAQ